MSAILAGWIVPPRPAHRRPAGDGVTHIRLSGEITADVAVSLFRAIRGGRRNTIRLELDSGGGDAVPALGIFDALIRHPRRVVVDVTGRASSGAAIVAMGADRRRIAETGTFLIHPTSGGDQKEREQVNNICVGILADATGQPRYLVDTWKWAETTFNADEALEIGLAHEVFSSTKARPEGRPADVPGAHRERRSPERRSPLANPKPLTLPGGGVPPGMCRQKGI